MRQQSAPHFGPTALDLADPRAWSRALGLLPVPLYGHAARHAYVMLNGQDGNFVLEVAGAAQGNVARSEGWSANIGHRVSLVNDDVIVQRWDRPDEARETFPARYVAERLERFHTYLAQQAPTSALSIVAHGVDAFEMMYRAFDGRLSRDEVLEIFLVLLACIAEEMPIQALDRQAWMLSDLAVERASAIDELQWQRLTDGFARGRPLDRLSLIPELLLRHASGELFQAILSRLDIDPVSSEYDTTESARAGHALDMRRSRFTPGALRRTMVEEALYALGTELPDPLRVLDPTCGSGDLLREFLRQLVDRGYRGTVILEGWDSSPAACAVSRFVLAWEQRQVPFRVQAQIVEQDALCSKVQWPVREVHAVLMHPPLVPWRDADADTRTRVIHSLVDAPHFHAGARPDLAFAFVHRALGAIASGGAIASVIPESLVDGRLAEWMRRELTAAVAPTLLARLGRHEPRAHESQHAALLVASRSLSTRRSSAVTPFVLWSDTEHDSLAQGLRALRRSRTAETVNETVGAGFRLYPDLSIGHDTRAWANWSQSV